jgi:DNA end-binding protein Ku
MAKKAPKKKFHKRSSGGPRSMWTGSISFGLVNIPIRLQPGVKKKTVHFHLVHEKDNARLKRKFFCSLEHKEVPDDEIKKAYDVGGDQNVIVEKEELEELQPKTERTIDILYFVDEKKIDPAYFDTPYYLQPDEAAKKPYELLVQALRETGKAGICQFVMRSRQHIGLVRAEETVLSLETMHFDDEVITVDELKWAPNEIKVNPRELKAAQELVESLSTEFEPEKLHDTYRESVLKLIDRKTAKKEMAEEKGVEEKDGPEVIDLMAALKKSLEQVKKHKGKKVVAA